LVRPAERHIEVALTDRQPPYAPEAEISVLGAMLIDGEAVAKAFEVVDVEMFYVEKHRRVFRVMQRLFGRGEIIDPVTIREELQKNGELESAGGHEFLSELLDAVPTAANVSFHAKVVRDRAQLRRLIRAGTTVVQLGYEPGDRSVAQVMDAAGQAVFDAVRDDVGEGPVWVKRDLWETFEAIERLQAAKGGITGLDTGLLDLNRMTGGFQKGDLVIIAARPSMGKTACAMGIAVHAAISQQLPVAVFSLEMTRQQLIQRMLCAEGLVDLSRLLNGQLKDDDYVRLAQVAGHFNTAPIYIDEQGDIGITQLRARVRRLKAEHPELALVVVDYVQLMSATGENRTQEVSGISRGLKSIAKEAGLPVLALSQLSREVEKRADKRPQLSDLRESGSLEQDADLVCFLFRPEYYFGELKTTGKGKDQRTDDLRNKAELIVAKQRNGPTGSVDLFFRKECVRFENWGNAR